jgi:hypothetical protein
MLKWTRENTLKGVVPNTSGIYTFYDRNRRLLYVGHSSRLRHRIQSYREVDPPYAHPTKVPLRPKIAYYAYEVMPVQRAARIEKQIKHRAPHNHL